MKYFIFSVLLVLTVPLRAQITLERSYSIGTEPSTTQIALNEIDLGLWKYVSYPSNHAVDNAHIMIYNLDHSLEKDIPVDQILPLGVAEEETLNGVARNLFDLSGKYVYLYTIQYEQNLIAYTALRVIREDSTVLFSCDSCQLYDPCSEASSCLDFDGIFATDSGVKMMIDNEVLPAGNHDVSIYSLPGKLPNRQSKQAGVSPSFTLLNNFVPTSAFPNPSNGPIRIAYQLPAGTFSGEIVVTSETGTEMKRCRVTNAFSDLLIDGTEFPSGSYFYKVVTEKGESAVGKFTLTK